MSARPGESVPLLRCGRDCPDSSPGDAARIRRDLGQQLDALPAEDRREEIDAGTLPPGRLRLATGRSPPDRPDGEDDRILLVAAFAARAERCHPSPRSPSTFIAQLRRAPATHYSPLAHRYSTRTLRPSTSQPRQGPPEATALKRRCPATPVHEADDRHRSLRERRMADERRSAEERQQAAPFLIVQSPRSKPNSSGRAVSRGMDLRFGAPRGYSGRTRGGDSGLQSTLPSRFVQTRQPRRRRKSPWSSRPDRRPRCRRQRSSGSRRCPSTLPSSTPHWSKLLMPHTAPLVKTRCSYSAISAPSERGRQAVEHEGGARAGCRESAMPRQHLGPRDRRAVGALSPAPSAACPASAPGLRQAVGQQQRVPPAGRARPACTAMNSTGIASVPWCSIWK